jgi:hypothetical protein
MANPLRDLLFGPTIQKRELAEGLIPRRSFADVILPASTRRQLEHALVQIKKHDLIFETWGLGERHATGVGLAFNFAGPPGTGKTICAEAIAYDIGKRLLVVRYAEMESLWAGESSKNISAVFRAAREADAVLFFDEADAIASRRFQSVTQGYQRESNAVVNVLLKELEDFDGVVIFATNLASNFDPAFERRIRTHILFDMPDAEARAKIWKVQLHARKTPLADDVDFDELARKYPASGGDIKNAVLKAAQMASAEPGPDAAKKIHQRHFVAGMEEVVAARKVMEQTIFEGDGSGRPQFDPQMLAGFSAGFQQLATNQEAMGEDLHNVIERSNILEAQLASVPEILNRFDESNKVARENLKTELGGRLDKIDRDLGERFTELKTELARGEERGLSLAQQAKVALVLGGVGVLAGIGGLIAALVK